MTDPAAQAARAQHIEKALLELVGATKELVAMLRHEAPGTPLNNHRFDALGVTVNNAITAAIAALEEAGASALHHFKDGDSTRCGAAQERGNSYYEWAYVDCPACLATQAQPSATDDAHTAPIPLNFHQQKAVTDWAADDRLWTTQDTVAVNLATFARVILKANTTINAAAVRQGEPPQALATCLACRLEVTGVAGEVCDVCAARLFPSPPAPEEET